MKKDTTDITMVIRSSWQVCTTFGNLNALCAATKTSCALMKTNTHLARKSKSVEKGEEMKLLKETFAGFHAEDVTVSEKTCLTCGEEACECAFPVTTVRGAYSPELAKNFKSSVYIANDLINVNATQPTLVILTANLATLAILISHQSMEELEAGRERFVLTVENFHGYVRGKHAKFPKGYAVAELDKTYMFGVQTKKLALTQQDEVKSVFPSHLVLPDSVTSQTLIDQILHFSKSIEASCMSVPAFRRLRSTIHHLRVPEKGTCWKRAVWIPMSSFLEGNGARRAEKKSEEQDQNDHFLTQNARSMEPLLVASADQSADCITRTHEKKPCYYLSECI